MRRVLARLASVALLGTLTSAGAVVAAAPAGAAACSGTSGISVVIDNGSSISTRCASGDYGTAMKALEAVADVVTPQQYPGSVVCRIDGYPSSDPCVRMPPADAYWAFFHAPRGGSWTYSSTGVSSYDPPAGSVIGFRFGSGQQPRTAPPDGGSTATPTPTRTTTAPKPTPTSTTSTPRSTPKGTSSTPRSGSATGSATGSSSASTGTASASATPRPSRTRWASPSASATPSTSDSPSALPSGSASPGDGPRTAAAAATSDGGSAGTGTLLAGGGLVLLVAGAAGWTVWRRRTG